MNDETLDFCPFCGGNPEIISLSKTPPYGRTFVLCPSCGSTGPAARRDVAIQAWNKRPERDALRESWRPMDTAPRDGSEILIYDPREGYGVNQAKWDEWAAAWVEVIEEHGRFEPSRWMPLPAPPADNPATHQKTAV